MFENNLQQLKPQHDVQAGVLAKVSQQNLILNTSFHSKGPGYYGMYSGWLVMFPILSTTPSQNGQL